MRPLFVPFRSLLLLTLLASVPACHGSSGSGGQDHRDGGHRGDAGDGFGSDDGGGDGDFFVDAGPGSSCGDGIRKKGLEACDDGNIVRGDGCDDQCQVESGYQCAAKGGTCATKCG